jgi:hypothetical protein
LYGNGLRRFVCACEPVGSEESPDCAFCVTLVRRVQGRGRGRHRLPVSIARPRR